MRHSFPEWYKIDETTLRTVMEQGAIALDANVLHHLYRLGEQQRHQVLTVLGHQNIRDRLWLPYQAGLEFQRNRLKNAYDQCRVYKELADEVGTHARQIKARFEERISDPEVRKIPVATLADLTQTIQSELLNLATTHVIDFADVEKEDPVLAAIDALLSTPDHIGTKPSDEELKKRVNESKIRYDQAIPPGYKDAKGPNRKPNPEGDYLIWSELLEYAGSIDRPLLFITNDEKEDWYLHSPDGKIRGPRPELRAEMAARTNKSYHQTTLKGFLRLAEQLLSIHVDQATIEQVEATTDSRGPRADTSAHQATSYFNAVVAAIDRTCPETQVLTPSTDADSGVDLFLATRNEAPVPVVIRYMRHKAPSTVIQKIAQRLLTVGGSTPKLIVANFRPSHAAEHMLLAMNVLFVTWDGDRDDEALKEAIQRLT